MRASLGNSEVTFVHNPDYDGGLASSLRCGLAELTQAAPDIAGALICLGDMPAVSHIHLNRLIEAFSPEEDSAICVPDYNGKQGNPVLWAARFFPEIIALKGDMGARRLIGEYSEMVCAVPFDDDAVLMDIDTTEAFKRHIESKVAE